MLGHDLRGQFEAEVHALGSNVEENVARCGDGMAAPERISRKGCSSAGRGAPKSLSQASEPNPATQVRPASISRNSTARIRPERSAQKARRLRVSAPRPGDAHHQKDRRPRQRCGDSLRNKNLVRLGGGVHIVCCDLHRVPHEYRIFCGGCNSLPGPHTDRRAAASFLTV